MKRNRNQRGFSLAEVLVATAVLVTVIVAVLMLYDRANKAFKQATEASELQQNVRVAYDRIIADIRMAGFDYKRGGPLLPGQTAAPWAPNRQYSAGTIVTPITANGHTYRATNAGTSGGGQPGWQTGTGSITNEPGATPPIAWQENGGAVYEQPDEQVEYAGATALTIRGNFDYSIDPTADDHGREQGSPGSPNLESAQFPVVTTGNDEVVTYALVPVSATATTTSLSFFADINNGGTPSRDAHPGGAAEETKTITGVDLTNSQPPYTLYRFTFEPDGSVRRTPLADNIRSLDFFYYSDASGQVPLRDAANVLAPNVGGGGQYSPTVAGSANAPERLVRKKIRSIRVRLVGMSSQSTPGFRDTSTAVGMLGTTSTAGVPSFVDDTVAPDFRRIAMDTLVSPRNLGVTGLPQSFLQPPSRPSVDSLCTGYCGIIVVNWNPNTTNPNASFAVLYDTDPAGSFSNVLNAGTANTLAVDLTQQDLTKTFYFKVRAFNAGGAVISNNVLSTQALNATDPNPPPLASLTATGGATPPLAALPGKILLTWSAPVQPASGSPTCTTGSPSVNTFLREIQGFRISRSTVATRSFACASCTIVADENSPLITSDGYGNYRFEDENVVCGTAYYYRIRTVEWCAANAAYNTSNNIALSISSEIPINSSNGFMGQAGSPGTPRTPVNVIIDQSIDPITMAPRTFCDTPTNLCTVALNWSRVTTATNNATIAIDDYEIERRMYDMSTGTRVLSDCPLCVPPVLLNTVTFQRNNALSITGSTIDFVDNTAPQFNPGTGGVNFEYEYRIRALQSGTVACPNGGQSLPVVFPPPCAFTGSVIVQTGASSGDGLTPQTAWVMNAGDAIQIDPPGGTTFANTDMTIIDPSGVIVGTISSPLNPAAFSWANLTPGDIYTVTFTMTNTAVPPCVEQIVRYIQQEPLPACSLETFANVNIVQQTAVNYQLKLDLVNNATELLNMEEIVFDWTKPNQIIWNNIQFPSGGTIPLGGTPAPNFTIDLNPTPVGLSPADVVVQAATGAGPGTESLLLNFAASAGSPANVTAAVLNNICVKYTRPSITLPGPSAPLTVRSLTGSGLTATADTTTAHGLITGNSVIISGASPATYNGTYVVSVVNPSRFTYTFAGGTSPATGTITMAPPLVPAVTLTSLTSSGVTVTADTGTAHRLVTGNKVLISGATEPEYNGTFTITVTGPTRFTYIFPGSATSPATGSVTAGPAPVPFLFSCAIKPDQNPNNPNTCN